MNQTIGSSIDKNNNIQIYLNLIILCLHQVTSTFSIINGSLIYIQRILYKCCVILTDIRSLYMLQCVTNKIY